MRYDIHVRESARLKIAEMAKDMSLWEAKPRIGDDEEKHIRSAIRAFPHTTKADDFRIGGVDGSGDYPSFAYADSFVYVASASGTLYRTDAVHGLREESALKEPTLEFVWLPGEGDSAQKRWLAAFSALAGLPVREVIECSDYRAIKTAATRAAHSVDEMLEDLILPRASDTANVGIQLRSTAELGTGLRLIMREPACRYVLMDTTFSLPMATRKSLSLFYEHVKRLCCVEAYQRGIAFLALSKSHGLPAMDQIETFAAEVLGAPASSSFSASDGEKVAKPDEVPPRNSQPSTLNRIAEHWLMRLPIPGIDDWTLSLTGERQIPPLGAVSYLFRLHRNTPVLRLDMDRTFWEAKFKDSPEAEASLFGDLDYCSHDQRAYGYPYPIKACHDRARLSNAEREALKKQIIDAAVAAGMKRSLFRDVSAATGHI